MNTIEYRKILPVEIPLIQEFPPAHWQLDLSLIYAFHYGEKYFFPLAALDDKVIAGTGMVILNGDTAWLGTIIVRDKYRKMGIGRSITEYLIEHAKNHGAKHILLFASEMGFPVYTKIGFETGSYYLMLKNGNLPEISDKNKIKPLNLSDLDEMGELDQTATGEKRKRLLEKTCNHGFKYVEKKKIQGYYLPDFGKGLIIAGNEHAGLELLKLMFHWGQKNLVVPEGNRKTIDYLLENGFEEYNRVPRMYLGSECDWKPEMIFSRGSGYMG